MTALAIPAAPKVRASNFRLELKQAFNLLRNGDHQVVDLGDPLWMCDLETSPLSNAQGGTYKWLLAQLGAYGTFYLHNAARPRPLAYLANPGGWGSPRITAISRSAGTIDLDNLTAGAVISEGDFGSWDDGPARRLHICGAGVANGSGVLTGLRVEPPPPATATASFPATFTMEKASAEMVLAESRLSLSGPGARALSFSAVQVIRRS